ncbi:MAG: hypothetical protein WA672_12240, partial [Candidatus Angelobacter sp.]
NTPSPLNQVARFMVLSSFQFELFSVRIMEEPIALGSWLVAHRFLVLGGRGAIYGRVTHLYGSGFSPCSS